MAILRLFHGTQVVANLVDINRFYHDVFGSWVYEAKYLDHEHANNSANILGGTFSMEVFCPADTEGQAPTARFLRRHGGGAINVAFWVDDLRAITQRLIDHGIRIALPGGTLIETLPETEFRFVVPHPKDAFGSSIELIEDWGLPLDPRRNPGWSSAFWRDRHPLSIDHLSHFTVAVADLDGASRFYREALGCAAVDGRGGKGIAAKAFRIGDTVAELAHPMDPETTVGRHLAAHGPSIQGFTFAVRDLAQARAYLDRLGLAPRARDDATIEIGPEICGGITYGFTSRSLAGG